MGAGGGLAFAVVFFVLPLSFVLHLGNRRFLRVSLAIAGGFSLFVAMLWLVCDVLDGEAGDRMWATFPMVPIGFLMAFVASLLVGLPMAVIRGFGRDQPPS